MASLFSQIRPIKRNMEISKALEEAKKNSNKRKFIQTIDIIISLRDYDIKRSAKLEDFIMLQQGLGKVNKI